MRKKTVILIALLTPLLMVGLFGSPKVSATTFNYTNFPMDDSTFRASFTMSPSDIQAFLQSKGSGLANFTDVEDCGSTAGSHYSYYAQYYSCGSRVSAAKIIYDAAQAYGINPQAILATIQKEQSLVTTPNPTSWQLNYAMGYGCPDSGSCSYAGFFNQVDNGSWQFRTDVELSSGRSYWGYAPTSYPCGGSTRYYSPGLLPGNTVTFYDDAGAGYAQFTIPNAATATLYCYTPHVFPGSSTQYYSGSYWFVYYFSLWFGSGTAPYAFKSATNPTIYMYVNGYKVVVPAMGILQDFSISPNAVQTLDQNKVDSIPTPSLASDGISPSLSYIVKSPSDSDADGGAIYLISIGKKYQVQTMQQFGDFGFNTNNISYLPLSFIQSIPSGGMLSNFISSPVSAAFQVSGGQKRIIFEYQTYRNLNPSDQATPVSYFISDLIPSGMPIVDHAVGIKYTDSDAVHLLTNGTYYSVPTFDTYNCWDFGNNLPVYRVAFNNYISAINAPASVGSCLVNDGSGNNYLLGKTTKFPVPASYGVTGGQTLDQNLLNLANKLPTANSLTPYIRGTASSAVWYIDSGVKKQVPTYSNFVLLHITPSQLTSVDDSALSAIPSTGIKLGTGQLVKTDSNSAVYVVNGNSRVLYATSDDFLGYHNSWSSIETYSAATLDQYYPYQNVAVKPYLYDQSSDSVYLVDPNGCYRLNSSMQTAYSKDKTTLASSQSYPTSIFVNLNFSSCKDGSQFAKDTSSSAVYLIENGQRRLFSTWDSLVQYSKTSNPNIITISNANLAAFPVGASMQ